MLVHFHVCVHTYVCMQHNYVYVCDIFVCDIYVCVCVHSVCVLYICHCVSESGCMDAITEIFQDTTIVCHL